MAAAPPTTAAPATAGNGTAGDTLEWKYVQSFGDDTASDDDLVTAVKFDETGDYLAVGDKAGRICIFEGHSARAPPSTSPHHPRVPPPAPSFLEYKFYTEFQSHDREFDSLKSVEIEEKINMIQWGRRQSAGMFLLATNDKTIKYWKVHEKKIKRVKNAGRVNQYHHEDIVIPRLTHSQTITTATPKRIFANAHEYHINSISINSDQSTFISADDLRINLWSTQVNSEAFTIVDLKPANIQELNEVITSATFHPTHCNILISSSSKGSIRLADLRDRALCDGHAKLFEVDSASQRSFFSEITSSISDAIFAGNDGRYLISRDYLTLKVWDVNMEARPLSVIPVHDYLRVHLRDLYDNDCIFDKFNVSASADGSRIVSGSYNNHFLIHNTRTDQNVTLEAARGRVTNPNVTEMDFGKKALHVSWHPKENTLAVAGLNKLYIYTAFDGTAQT